MALEILSTEERQLWSEMRKELAKRHSYHFKKQFYPFKLDEWENENKRVESTYREKITLLNKQRKQTEKKQQAAKDRMEAAQALLLLAHTTQRKAKREVKKKLQKIVPQTPRRSKRIQEKEQAEKEQAEL